MIQIDIEFYNIYNRYINSFYNLGLNSTVILTKLDINGKICSRWLMPFLINRSKWLFLKQQHKNRFLIVNIISKNFQTRSKFNLKPNTFFLQYIIISMEVTVKIKFENNNKIFSISGNYQELRQKLMNNFKLQLTAYYQLSYINPHGQEISITNSQQFIEFCKCQFKQKPTMTLQKTEQAALHFQAESTRHQSTSEKNQELQQMIEQLKQQVKAKFQEFKAETRKQISYELKQQSQSLKKRPKGQKSKVIHNGIACQSCQVKEVQGVRYECAICDYNICETCEQRGYEHNPTHPLIKIKDQTQMLAMKDNKLKRKKEKKQEPLIVEGPHINMQLVKMLMEWSSMNQTDAIAFIRKHPTKTIEELVEARLNQS